MAKKIKFALEMADGTNVRTSIEELREHYDQQSILEYFNSGKLQEWLEDRYYEKEADEIADLSKDDNNLNEKLCAIINGEEYGESSKEDNSVSSYTEPLPEKVQPVPDKPLEEKKEYKLQDFFESIKQKYGENEAKAEKLHFENKFEEAGKIFLEEAKKGVYRAYFFLIQFFDNGYGDFPMNENISNKIKKELLYCDDILVKCEAVSLFLEEEDRYYNELKKIEKKLYGEAIGGDPFASYMVFVIKSNGYDVPADIMEKCEGIVQAYNYGEGINQLGNIAVDEKGYKTAIKYYDRASKLGCPLAQYNLAGIYYEGFGVKEDIDKAFKLYKAAAEARDPSAQFCLAECYLAGEGVEEDSDTAFKLYKAAAEKGCTDAMEYLGDCYYDEVQDYDEAEKWYRMGATRNNNECIEKLRKRYVCGKDYKMEDINESLGEVSRLIWNFTYDDSNPPDILFKRLFTQ